MRSRLSHIARITRFNRPMTPSAGIEEKIAYIARMIYENAMDCEDHATWTHWGIGGNKEMQRAVRARVTQLEA